MALQTVLPFIGGTVEAKDLVITILSSKWPLNARELFFLARNKYGSNLTYTSIHKSIVKLYDDEVLEKLGKDYSLNQDWLIQLKEFAENTNGAYDASDLNESFGQDNMLNLMFYSPIDAIYGLVNLVYKEFKTRGSETSVASMKRVWPIICSDKKHFTRFQQFISASSLHIVVEGNTKADAFLIDFFNEYGASSKLGARNCSNGGDILVFNDFVAKLVFPSVFKKQMERYCTRTNGFDNGGLRELYDVAYSTCGETRLQLVKNRELATEITGGIMRYFK